MKFTLPKACIITLLLSSLTGSVEARTVIVKAIQKKDGKIVREVKIQHLNRKTALNGILEVVVRRFGDIGIGEYRLIPDSSKAGDKEKFELHYQHLARTTGKSGGWGDAIFAAYMACTIIDCNLILELYTGTLDNYSNEPSSKEESKEAEESKKSTSNNASSSSSSASTSQDLSAVTQYAVLDTTNQTAPASTN